VAYANSIKSLTLIANRLCALRGLGSLAQPIPEDEGLTRLAEAETRRGEVWEQVLLLGDPDTIAAARFWHERVWELVLLTRGRDATAPSWAETMKEMQRARAAFYKSARRNLGVIGDVPAAPWPRRTLPHDGP
jgi:hypothetical protein